MKEVINSQQNKKGLLRKATATVGMLAALAGCGEPPIKEGTVYHKEYEEKTEWTQVHIVGGKVPISIRWESPENWKVYIAECPNGELPPQEKIKKECRINSFDVPQEIYNSLQIGQQADFKQTK